jgi:hypothetical protein
MLDQSGPETRFLGVSQVKWFLVGRLLIGEGGSFGEKPGFFAPCRTVTLGGMPGTHRFVVGALAPEERADEGKK